jgi:hypothetical protein
MKPSRDMWIALALLVVLALVTVAAGIQETQREEKAAYDSRSSQPKGALALREWLSAMGYEVLPDRLSVFAPPAKARLIFVLEPSGVSQEDIETLDAWVKQGNTLVVGGIRPGARMIAMHYGFSMVYADPAPGKMVFQNPLLSNPAANQAVSLQADYTLSTSRTDYVTYLGSDGRPVLVSFRSGQGRVILTSSAYLFSNQGLKETGMPEVTLNILRLAENNGPVWFDEWHHGDRAVSPDDVRGPSQWLARTPIGRSLLLVAAIVFIGLLMQGQLFGKPVPPARDLRRRAPLEYIRALANLGRRAGHRRHVLAQYYNALKRGLGKRYRLDPSLTDREYVSQLSKYNPAIDQAALFDLLLGLQKRNVSEAEMVKLAAQAAEWLKET